MLKADNSQTDALPLPAPVNEISFQPILLLHETAASCMTLLTTS